MSSAIGWPFRAGLNMDFTTMDFNRGWPHHIDTGSDEWKTYRIPFTHYITRYNAHSLDIWRKIYTVMMNIDGLLQNCSIFRRKPFSEKQFGSNVLIGAENSIYSIFSANSQKIHDDVIKWKHFPRYWPFVRGIHRSPVNSPHKGQWRGALMFSLICV